MLKTASALYPCAHDHLYSSQLRSCAHGSAAPVPRVRMRVSVLALRTAQPTDIAAIVEVTRRSKAQGLPYLPVLHTPDEDIEFFGRYVHDGVATLATIDRRVVGYSAVTQTHLDQLYVAPEWWSLGIGTALLRRAMSQRPDGLQLWAFRRNTRATSFYVRHGFSVVETTNGEGNEEREPDARLHWPGGHVEPPDSYEFREGTRVRRAVRGVIVDPDDNVLLAQWQRPEFDKARWILPGGGVKIGETLDEALRRELHEETGIVVTRPMPLIWVLTTRVVGASTRWGGQVNHIFLIRAPHFDPVPGMSPEELARENMVGLSWWSPAELAAQPDALGPRPVPALLDDLRRHGPPAKPLVLDVRS